MKVLLIFFGSAALAGVVILWLYRLYARWFGLTKVIEDGVALTEHGIEVLGTFLVYKYRIDYRRVVSVELLENSSFMGAVAKPRYWMARRIGTQATDPVAIKLKGTFFGSEYLIATPKDGAAFVAGLKKKMAELAAVGSGEV